MIMLWGLKRINIVKQSHHGVTVLSSRNPTLLNNIKRISARAHNIPGPKISRKSEQKFQLIDNVSKDYKLIYKSPIATIIIWSYRCAYFFVLTGIAGMFYVYKQPHKVVENLPPVQVMLTRQNINETRYLFGGLILMNIALIIFCRMHVVRIWFSPKVNLYTMQIIGNLPGFPKQIVFEPGVPKLKRKKPITSLGRSAHLINGKTYHIIDTNFKTPAEYEKFIGTVAHE